jgi:hypothetical protein
MASSSEQDKMDEDMSEKIDTNCEKKTIFCKMCSICHAGITESGAASCVSMNLFHKVLAIICLGTVPATMKPGRLLHICNACRITGRTKDNLNLKDTFQDLILSHLVSYPPGEADDSTEKKKIYVFKDSDLVSFGQSKTIRKKISTFLNRLKTENPLDVIDGALMLLDTSGRTRTESQWKFLPRALKKSVHVKASR